MNAYLYRYIQKDISMYSNCIKQMCTHNLQTLFQCEDKHCKSYLFEVGHRFIGRCGLQNPPDDATLRIVDSEGKVVQKGGRALVNQHLAMPSIPTGPLVFVENLGEVICVLGISPFVQ